MTIDQSDDTVERHGNRNLPVQVRYRQTQRERGDPRVNITTCGDIVGSSSAHWLTAH